MSEGAALSASDVAFEFLHFLRHHFVARVMRTTPSGRQQSSVLVVLTDCVCLLSNRGGIHTHIPIRDIVALTTFPRGKVCIHAKKRHDLLITCSQQPKLVLTIQQLFAGLCGQSLPVHQDDSAPQVERLTLRPSADWQPAIPRALVKAIQQAALSAASFATASVQAALVDPCTPNDFSPQRNQSLGGRGLNASLTRECSSMPEPQKSASVAPSESCVTAAITAAEWAKSKKEEAATAPITVLVVESNHTILTVPALRPLWVYLNVLCDLLPAARRPPLAVVHCVEDPFHKIEICTALLHQTMAMFAEEQPHLVTLQKRLTDEGHTFDGETFWVSMAQVSK